MIRDLRTDHPAAADVAQVCIVGAGAAGITLALELARLGKRVVLLEAGGREIEDEAQEPYRSEVSGHVHRGVHTGRFRALGGTTQRWGGQILELNAEDFEPRPWVKGSGWPLAKAELEPFYARALELEGVAGSLQQDSQVWKALRLQPPAFDQLEPYLTRWCPEPGFARLHGPVLDQSEAIEVWLHASVVELLYEGDAVRGVRVRSSASEAPGQEVTFRAEKFVFCLGTIECVRLFLQPREGGLPWNRSGLLGCHFQDHIDVNVATVTPRDRRRFGELFDNVVLGGYKYHPKLRLSPDMQEQLETLNSALTVTFSSESDAALDGLKTTAKHLLRRRWDQLHPRDGLLAFKHGPLLLQQGWKFFRDRRVYNPRGATVRLRVHCEQEPEGASSISLGNERDSLGLWRTRLDWQISPKELRTIRCVAEVATRALSGLADVQTSDEVEDDRALAARCDDSNHHMGGMRMSASESGGVVSPDLRVHGTTNAYVCSGAVFPCSGFSNPTHTIIALAMRLAVHLAKGFVPDQLVENVAPQRTPAEKQIA